MIVASINLACEDPAFPLTELLVLPDRLCEQLITWPDALALLFMHADARLIQLVSWEYSTAHCIEVIIDVMPVHFGSPQSL